MPGIDNQHAEITGIRIMEEVFHQFRPALLFLQRHLGKSVAGQVDHVEFPVNQKVVHMYGFARAGSDAGELFPVQNPVDDRGLPHV